MNSRFWLAIEHALASQAQGVDSLDSFAGHAAVLALITDSPSPELIFTLRAKHLNHHAGEVCFPGGMWESHDASLTATALRETHEEIGLAPNMIEVLGALPPRTTRSGTLVHPFVGRIAADNHFRLNHHELETLFSVPLTAFRQGLQVRMDSFERHGVRTQIPAYHYKGYEIWGFTAGVTAQLLDLLRSFYD